MFTFVFTTALVAVLAQSQPALPKVGAPAPAFVFSDLMMPEGKQAVAASEFTPARLKGKVVVLDFFATWCAPCVEAIPHTNALIASATDLPVVYLAVTDQTREVLTDFLKGRPFEAIVAFDREKTTFTNYFIAGLPFVVIIDSEGRISAFSHPARVTRAMLEAAVKPGAGPPPAMAPAVGVRLASLALRVHNEDAMVAFYNEAFGMTFRVVETSGIRSRFGELNGLTIKLVPIRDAAQFEGFPVHQPGFEVPSVGRVIEIARRHGGRVFDAPVERDGRVYASLRDPDGNTIEISGGR